MPTSGQRPEYAVWSIVLPWLHPLLAKRGSGSILSAKERELLYEQCKIVKRRSNGAYRDSLLGLTEHRVDSLVQAFASIGEMATTHLRR